MRLFELFEVLHTLDGNVSVASSGRSLFFQECRNEGFCCDNDELTERCKRVMNREVLGIHVYKNNVSIVVDAKRDRFEMEEY